MDEEEYIQEIANRCLGCKTKPCRAGCPLGNDITEFIKCIKEKEYKKAYDILLDTTVLQAVCGRICPHSKQCQGSCVRGIKGKAVSIGELEAFIRRYGNKRELENHKIRKGKWKKHSNCWGRSCWNYCSRLSCKKRL